jgi:hypothetical protein
MDHTGDSLVVPPDAEMTLPWTFYGWGSGRSRRPVKSDTPCAGLPMFLNIVYKLCLRSAHEWS